MADSDIKQVQVIAGKIAELGIDVGSETMVFALALATASYLKVAFPARGDRYDHAAGFFRDMHEMLRTLDDKED